MDLPTGLPNLTATEDSFVAYGLPGYEFSVIHGISVFTLFISIVISTAVLISIRPGKDFFSWPIGDRIVVYLATCDLVYSITNIQDHIVMLVKQDFTPDIPCAIVAFFHHEAVFSQALIVVFAALNAFAMVVYRRRLHTGKYDWRLLGMAYGGPALIGVVGLATDHFGPSEAWCYIDLRRPLGRQLNTAITVLMVITFLFMCVCYLAIWLKIRHAAKFQTPNKKYHRTAKVMMVFVAAYILQWWAAVWYGMWGIWATPQVVAIVCTLVFATLGGLWNFIAYTLIRKPARRVTEETTVNSVSVSQRMRNSLKKTGEQHGGGSPS